MKLVNVVNNQSAMVDDEDYDHISSFTWHKCGNGYPTRRVPIPGGGNYREGMHRTIMGLASGDRRHVDHINGNSFDNRRCNLRVCEPLENWWNAQRRSDNTSGYKGVSWSKSNGKWAARIKRNRKRIHLGYFVKAEEAYAAYCEAAQRLHGEFAHHLSKSATNPSNSADAGEGS
jgi:hypothetical protein